jgi:hypothetical protein
MRRQQAARAALLGLVDIAVAMLTDALIERLGVQTTARSLILSRATQRHIMARRSMAGTADAQLAANRLHEVLEDLRFLVPLQDGHKFKLVGRVESPQRWVAIVVKFVPGTQAKAKADEWWISTAYPLGQKKLRRLRSSGELVPLGEKDLSS